MKKLAIAIIFAGLVWAAWWAFAAYRLNGATQDWAAARRADGWTASYSDLSIKGFPNRLDRTFTDLELADPNAGVSWKAPFFQIFQLSYNPNHLIVAWPPQQTLAVPGATFQIDSEGLRASAIRDGASLLRANFEAVVLNIHAADHGALALANPTAALQRLDADGAEYRLMLTAQSVATDTGAMSLPSAESAQNIRADITARFDQAWTVTAQHNRPQPTELDITLAEYALDETVLRLTGKLQIAADGTPSGKLTVQARNWQSMLETARQDQALPTGVIDTVEQGLSMLAALRGNPKTLDIPLNLSGGMILLGPVPIAPAPRLRLP